ncbi:hypothetical protein [Speluncibacter jeojiensis]|uniref:hypothetical protein n=1 Tax=Speluncibacter jeojiensis TaxID=2710754 RepID=UPI00240FB26C|nr:hypothetical protein [Rhodococcus sp. D2-41]
MVGDTFDTLFPVTLSAPPPPPGLPAYGRLLRDVFCGDPTLCVRGDEAEQAWRVVAPVLSTWSRGLVPLAEYPSGSSGPAGGAGS